MLELGNIESMAETYALDNIKFHNIYDNEPRRTASSRKKTA